MWVQRYEKGQGELRAAPILSNTITRNPYFCAMSTTAVVILNWNGRALLEQFLPAVMQHTGSGAEIIVADNASTDDSVAFLEAHYPGIRIIRNSRNGGYARGYNEALAEVDADYYVLLNSDIEVTPGWLQPLVKLMDENPGMAACQPKIRSFHQRECFEYAGAAGGFIDKWGFPFCRGRLFNAFETDNGQYNDTCDVFWATGACLMMRATDWKAAHGLDEDFFAHMEEIDLCWRLRNMGRRIGYCGNSTVFHVGGGTLSQINPRKTFLNFRNNLVMIAKNHAPGWFGIKIFLRLIIDGVAGVRFLLSGDWKHCFAVIRAHFNFYAQLPRTLKKRRKLKAGISQYATSAVYNGSVVFAHFLHGKKHFSELDAGKFSR